MSATDPLGLSVPPAFVAYVTVRRAALGCRNGPPDACRCAFVEYACLAVFDITGRDVSALSDELAAACGEDGIPCAVHAVALLDGLADRLYEAAAVPCPPW